MSKTYCTEKTLQRDKHSGTGNFVTGFDQGLKWDSAQHERALFERDRNMTYSMPKSPRTVRPPEEELQRLALQRKEGRSSGSGGALRGPARRHFLRQATRKAILKHAASLRQQAEKKDKDASNSGAEQERLARRDQAKEEANDAIDQYMTLDQIRDPGVIQAHMRDTAVVQDEAGLPQENTGHKRTQLRRGSGIGQTWNAIGREFRDMRHDHLLHDETPTHAVAPAKKENEGNPLPKDEQSQVLEYLHQNEQQQPMPKRGGDLPSMLPEREHNPSAAIHRELLPGKARAQQAGSDAVEAPDQPPIKSIRGKPTDAMQAKQHELREQGFGLSEKSTQDRLRKEAEIPLSDMRRGA